VLTTKVTENFILVLRYSEIVGVIRYINGKPKQYVCIENENRLFFLMPLKKEGYQERIEFRFHGCGEIKRNTNVWDFSEWDLQAVFKVKKKVNLK
jgi:hypothetical protein